MQINPSSLPVQPGATIKASETAVQPPVPTHQVAAAGETIREAASQVIADKNTTEGTSRIAEIAEQIGEKFGAHHMPWEEGASPQPEVWEDDAQHDPDPKSKMISNSATTTAIGAPLPPAPNQTANRRLMSPETADSNSSEGEPESPSSMEDVMSVPYGAVDNAATTTGASATPFTPTIRR